MRERNSEVFESITDIDHVTNMDNKFGRSVKTPVFSMENDAELECWRKFIRRFEIAVIGAGLRYKGSGGIRSRRKAEDSQAEKFEREQRKAALLLDSMGEYGMNIFETWDGDVDAMQYEQLKVAFDNHFASRENIVATRHRFLCMEQRRDERL